MPAITDSGPALCNDQLAVSRTTMRRPDHLPLWPNKLVIEDIPVGARCRKLLEHSAAEGEQWLRRSAENGDFYAMESLGVRLFNGDGLSKSSEEGLVWLTRSAELGSPTAMARLAECLLESVQSRDSREKAEQWLQRSVDNGNTEAALILGTRLIAGRGLPADPTRGMRLLIDAAYKGSQLAHIKLGVNLLAGRKPNSDREGGLRWLRRIGASSANHISLLGHYVYMKSLAATTRGGARILAEEAGVLFHEAAQQDNALDELNLAYLLRRGEISCDTYPSIEALLASHVQQKNAFALVNEALRLAKGSADRASDWNEANALVEKASDVDAVFGWWFSRSTEGDAEGHLVTGWLVRSQLAIDPEHVAFPCRMDLARQGGWNVPTWMNHPTVAARSR